jgi:soluble lytic murein transglycosylase-like protein
VAYQESRFKTDARSHAGAHGIMQFMPATAMAYKVNTHDALSSIVGGDRLLADLRNRFGNDGLALAAYNCGSGCVSSYLKGKRTLPKETRDYVKAITGHTVEAWRASKVTMPSGGHRKAMERHLAV